MTVTNGDILRLTAKMSVNENDVQNVYHIRINGGPVADGDIVDGLGDAMDFIYDYIEAYSPATLDFDTIAVWSVTEDRPLGEIEWPTLTNGSGVGDIAPLQLAALVLFGTETARSQGRKFMPPPLEEHLTAAGTISAAYQAALADFGAALLPVVIVDNWEYEFGNWRGSISLFSEWETAIVKDIIRTQRRRVAGVGS